MRLRVWDTAGVEIFRKLVLSYRTRAQAAIIVYDITRQETLQNTEEWFDILRDRSSQNVFTALLGNKADLVDRRQVTYKVICVCSHINSLRQA